MGDSSPVPDSVPRRRAQRKTPVTGVAANARIDAECRQPTLSATAPPHSEAQPVAFAPVSRRLARAAAAAAMAAVLGTMLPAAGPQAARADAFGTATYENFAGSELMRLTNLDRTSLGLAPMTPDPYLEGLAGESAWRCPEKTSLVIPGRARDMADRNYMSHDIPGCPTSMVDLLGEIGYSSRGENIGVDNFDGSSSPYAYGCDAAGKACAGTTYGVPLTVAWIEGAFMRSPSHRANILGKWNRFGCAAARRSGTSGDVYYTCLFSDRGPNPLDADPPVFTDFGGGGTHPAGSPVTLSVQFTDASRIAAGRLSVDGVVVDDWAVDRSTARSGSRSVTLDSVASGRHTAEWTVTDAGSTDGVLPVEFTVGGGVPAPDLSVSFPADDAFAVVGRGFRLSWSEDGGDPALRLLTEYRADMPSPGSCDGASYTMTRQWNPADSSTDIAGLADAHCYRYDVLLRAGAGTAVAASAPRLASSPSASFSMPSAGFSVTRLGASSMTVAWSVANASGVPYTAALNGWSAPVPKASTCAGAVYALAFTRDATAAASAKVSVTAGRCWRFSLDVANAAGTTASWSGSTYSTLSRVTVTAPRPGTIARSGSAKAKVAWSIFDPDGHSTAQRIVRRYRAARTATGCGTSWRLVSTGYAASNYAWITTSAGYCWKATVQVRDTRGFLSAAVSSGVIRR
jgi:hypothetical protein